MDPFLIIVAVALALFIFMQFRTAKKRRNDAAELQAKMLPGTEIMTNYGLYGTIVSIDDENNIATIETTPGTLLRIHRQTILKAVEDEVAEEQLDEEASDAPVGGVSDAAAEPEFGERTDETSTKRAQKDSE